MASPEDLVGVSHFRSTLEQTRISGLSGLMDAPADKTYYQPAVDSPRYQEAADPGVR